jgi:multidrug efflux system outer membrane protein
MRRSAALGIVAVLLAGCMVGPDYTRPSIDAPASFRFEPTTAADTANTAWWRQFGDPVLDALIAEALANNRNVKIAAANIVQATGLLTQTRSSLFPQVGYGATGQRQKIPDIGLATGLADFPNPQTSYQALLSASWEIDFWGRIRRLSEAALANALASDDARDAVILSLVASVANTYIQLRGLDEHASPTRRSARMPSRYSCSSPVQVWTGFADERRAGAIAVRDRGAVRRSSRRSRRPRIHLPCWAGIPVRSSAENLDELVVPTVPAGMPSQVLEHRPDIDSPSNSWWPPTPRSARRRRFISRRSR